MGERIIIVSESKDLNLRYMSTKTLFIKVELSIRTCTKGTFI